MFKWSNPVLAKYKVMSLLDTEVEICRTILYNMVFLSKDEGHFTLYCFKSRRHCKGEVLYLLG